MDLKRENFDGLGDAIRSERRRLIFAALAVAAVIGIVMLAWPLIDHNSTLKLTYTESPGAEPVSWVIDCQDAQSEAPMIAACQFLEVADQSLFDSPAAPGDCPPIDGGDATFRVSGEVRGDNVDLTYDRADGCRLMRWNQIIVLLETMPGGLPEQSRELQG